MKKLFAKAAVVFVAVCFLSCAQKKDVAIYPEYFRLENGLSVFVKEDHKVPLVYFEIAVRAGAVTQRSDNAGIFHLYEHMMFKGNSLYPNASAVQKALSDMGVDDWNGTTSEHCVNYFFTVPSSELKKGMEFWSAAIREPLLDNDEFEGEKKVVVSEIIGRYNEPSIILSQFFNKTFFSAAPWQLDPGGSIETIQNATLDELKSIKEKYYVPNNAAIFVGGDVDAATVKKLAEEIFGDWQAADFDFSSECAAQNAAPLESTRFFVHTNEQVSPQIANVSIFYRGPDADFDRASTYPLDIFTNYINDPESDFVADLVADDDLRIIAEEYVGGGYSTHRRTSLITFYGVMLDASDNIASRAKNFYSAVSDKIVGKYVASKKIVSDEKFKRIIRSSKDNDIISAELPENVLATARYWWTVADVDYYFGYDKNFSKVTNDSIASALEQYIKDKNAFVVVSVNPEIYEAHKADFDRENFVKVTREDAYWFDGGLNKASKMTTLCLTRGFLPKPPYSLFARANQIAHTRKLKFSAVRDFSGEKTAAFKLDGGIADFAEAVMEGSDR